MVPRGFIKNFPPPPDSIDVVGQTEISWESLPVGLESKQLLVICHRLEGSYGYTHY